MAELGEHLGALGLEIEPVGRSIYVRGDRATAAGSGRGRPPLDWCPPWSPGSRAQEDLLQVRDGAGHWVALPQLVVVDPLRAPGEGEVRLEVRGAFRPPDRVERALDLYRPGPRDGAPVRLFDGANARLCGWDGEGGILSWQKCQYFDYLMTNLSLDALILPDARTLRASQLGPGVIRPLAESTLANSTGVNGLVFTSDGYMIYQRRRPDVLIRPGGLCSGFSGTVDWDDIVHAVEKGATLARLDALREMFEELDVRRDEVERRWWLGATQEIIRGGAPELFYAACLKIPADALLGRVPRDREGAVLKLRLDGSPGAGGGRAEPITALWAALHQLAREGGGPITIPLLTNLVLWWRAAGRAGTRVAGLGEGPE